MLQKGLLNINPYSNIKGLLMLQKGLLMLQKGLLMLQKGLLAFFFLFL
jgi:hypothetical protein